jgi:hypothetical protein
MQLVQFQSKQNERKKWYFSGRHHTKHFSTTHGIDLKDKLILIFKASNEQKN